MFRSPDAEVWLPLLGATGSVAIGIANLFWAALAGAGGSSLALLVPLWLALVAYWLYTTRTVAQVVITPQDITTEGVFGWWRRSLRWHDVASVGIESKEPVRGVALSLVIMPRGSGAPLRISNRTSRYPELAEIVRQRVAQAQAGTAFV